MANSSQVREWWEGYQHDFDKYVKVGFPGENGKIWNLWVADRSAPIWEAVTQIMASTPYLFRESTGGTYSEREPGSVSLHTYALALDLNPSENPQKPPPLVYDYPAEFIERMEGIRAEGQQALMWGGRWPDSNPPDTMHWQINVPPSACDVIEWDTGDGMANWKSEDGYTYGTADWPPHEKGIKFVIDGGIMLGERNDSKKTGEFHAQEALERGEFATVMKRFSDDVGLTSEVND